MSQNYPQQNPKKLHSPLLDGYYKTENYKTNLKDKKRLISRVGADQESSEDQILEETIDKTLFTKNNNQTTNFFEEDNINLTYINGVETCFKVFGVFIAAMGGILSVLQAVSLGTDIYNRDYVFGNSSLIFGATVIGSIVGVIVCLGFSHLVRSTKYIYLSLEEQKAKMNEILEYYNRVNYKAR